LIQKILASQRLDGGWSQTPEMPSDAYATGQTLYALTRAGVKPNPPRPRAFGCSFMVMPEGGFAAFSVDGEALGRATFFLQRAQSVDGSWPVTSRPAPPSNKPAGDLRPITHAATAWAVLGLLGALSE
jgi:N-acyl-D-amino-acid deacylase